MGDGEAMAANQGQTGEAVEPATDGSASTKQRPPQTSLASVVRSVAALPWCSAIVPHRPFP